MVRRLSALFVAILLCAGMALAQDIRFFRIGTGTTGGTYFPIGGLIASAISSPPGGLACLEGGSCGVPGLIAVAQATAGSRANIDALRAGRLDSAFVQADVAFWAHRGAGPFEGQPPFTELRALASLYPEAVHVVVRADGDLRELRDLKGKRVGVGEQGSGTLINARAILAALGIGENGVEHVHVAPGPAADQLVRGDIDAFFITGGAPLEAVGDLARRMPIRLLPVEEGLAAKLRRDLPFVTTTVIPKGAYEGVAETTTLGVPALWMTTTTLDETLAHDLTRALWEPSTLAILAGGHPRGAAIRPENALRGVSTPLHPGAARFYRERGLMPSDTER